MSSCLHWLKLVLNSLKLSNCITSLPRQFHIPELHDIFLHFFQFCITNSGHSLQTNRLSLSTLSIPVIAQTTAIMSPSFFILLGLATLCFPVPLHKMDLSTWAPSLLLPLVFFQSFWCLCYYTSKGDCSTTRFFFVSIFEYWNYISHLTFMRHFLSIGEHSTIL